MVIAKDALIFYRLQMVFSLSHCGNNSLRIYLGLVIDVHHVLRSSLTRKDSKRRKISDD